MRVKSGPLALPNALPKDEIETLPGALDQATSGEYLGDAAIALVLLPEDEARLAGRQVTCFCISRRYSSRIRAPRNTQILPQVLKNLMKEGSVDFLRPTLHFRVIVRQLRQVQRMWVADAFLGLVGHPLAAGAVKRRVEVKITGRRETSLVPTTGKVLKDNRDGSISSAPARGGAPSEVESLR